MPRYEYHCPEGHTFDLFRSIATRDDPSVCPECGTASAREQIPIQGSRVDTGGGYEFAMFTKDKGKGSRVVPGHIAKEAPTLKQGKTKGKWR